MKAIRMIVPLVLVLALSSVVGCATIKHVGRVAVIETHEALDQLWGDSTNEPISAVLTNALPSTVKPDAAQGCDCDLTAPLCDAPYSKQWLDEQGNATECPVPHGMDIRGNTFYPSDGMMYSLHLLPLMVSGKQADGMVYGKCPTKDGYRYHFLGYSDKGVKTMTPAKPGELFKYTYKMKVWHNVRKVK